MIDRVWQAIQNSSKPITIVLYIHIFNSWESKWDISLLNWTMIRMSRMYSHLSLFYHETHICLLLLFQVTERLKIVSDLLPREILSHRFVHWKYVLLDVFKAIIITKSDNVNSKNLNWLCFEITLIVLLLAFSFSVQHTGTHKLTS
jgi:hypothetical protein